MFMEDVVKDIRCLQRKLDEAEAEAKKWKERAKKAYIKGSHDCHEAMKEAERRR